jgi:two-component system nitrogen regulation sensor histidine kinase NtrY
MQAGFGVRRMPESSRQRKMLIALLGGGFLVLFLGFAILNGFNLRILDAHSTSQIFLYTALTVLAFLLFVVVILLLLRNIFKLFTGERSRVLGSLLRTRMLVWAGMMAFLPVLFMSLFSYMLMNRSLDRWFTQPVVSLRDDANQLASELQSYTASNARAEADALATAVNQHKHFAAEDNAVLQREIRRREITLQGGFAAIYHDGREVAAFNVPQKNGGSMQLKMWLTGASSMDVDSADTAPVAITETIEQPTDNTPDAVILRAAQRNDQPIFSFGQTDYALGTAWIKQGGVVVVGLPMPRGMSATVSRLHKGTDAYWTLFGARRQIRTTYMVLLALLSALTFFASSWLALQFSRQVTRPVEALADAMQGIAAGDYTQRLDASATEELGELMRSFNQMAADLESSRAQLQSSSAQLSAANSALEERRRELETMLETMPNGVVMLDQERRIILANRAFSEMMDPGGQQPFLGLPLQMVFPAETAGQLNHLVRRSHRMGSANGEFEVHVSRGTLNLVVSVAMLESKSRNMPGRRGYVVVLEDATELLRAQKQVAWKEVARRVAHEIKNPLTPVALSAERIRNHIDRLDQAMQAGVTESPSVEVIRKSSEIITGSVETMRQLVDQFSALAQFPASRPRPADLNTIVENSLAMFAGRLQTIDLHIHLAHHLPLVMADPEALQRAITNLIDNAAEAMHQSLLRVLTVSTCLLESGSMVELIIADTGHGLTDEMRERLFMPYFSTKERGTGLGLTIAAKIVQEHEGTIRAEANTPKGARFLIELPVALLPDEDFGDKKAGPEVKIVDSDGPAA